MTSMDMSVTSYSKAVLTELHTFGEGCESHIQAMAPDAPWTLEGMNPGRCYTTYGARTKRFGTDAASHETWLRDLLWASSGTNLDSFENSPDSYEGIPFRDLALFGTGPGILGPVVAARVANDFKSELHGLVKTWARQPNRTHLLLMIMALFENAASDEGIVQYR